MHMGDDMRGSAADSGCGCVAPLLPPPPALNPNLFPLGPGAGADALEPVPAGQLAAVQAALADKDMQLRVAQEQLVAVQAHVVSNGADRHITCSPCLCGSHGCLLS
jgi:hypothetical protein